MPDNPTPHRYQIPILSNGGDNVIVVQFTDGGIRDDDLSENGVIVDKCGRVPASTPVRQRGEGGGPPKDTDGYSEK